MTTAAIAPRPATTKSRGQSAPSATRPSGISTARHPPICASSLPARPARLATPRRAHVTRFLTRSQVVRAILMIASRIDATDSPRMKMTTPIAPGAPSPTGWLHSRAASTTGCAFHRTFRPRTSGPLPLMTTRDGPDRPAVPRRQRPGSTRRGEHRPPSWLSSIPAG